MICQYHPEETDDPSNLFLSLPPQLKNSNLLRSIISLLSKKIKIKMMTNTHSIKTSKIVKYSLK